MNYIYDIESFPNVFILCARHYESGAQYYFEISDYFNNIEQLRRFIKYLAYTGSQMIGYNNLSYDYPVLHAVLSDPTPSADTAYQKTISIIGSIEKFGHMIWPKYRYVRQLDLYKIHHFDNMAKTTSLKTLQFNMRSESVVELPFEPGKILTKDEIFTLREYCFHDVTETEKFYVESLPQIQFRQHLTEKYNRDFTNHNDTKIGKDYFIMRLEESGIRCYTDDRKPRQTIRDSIAFSDIIFPYIRFDHPEFCRISNLFKSLTRFGTDQNGVILRVYTEDRREWCTEVISTLGAKILQVDHEYLTIKIPHSKINHIVSRFKAFNVKTKKLEEILVDTNYSDKTDLSCTINGFAFNFGTGGIHGSINAATVYADQDHSIIDLDVTSYYPSLAIANGLYPEHLGKTFCTIYADIKTQRIGYKKGTPENLMLKLALNGVFGDTNNIYSVLYDPVYTMAITVNGQLLLCMLAEQIVKIPGVKLLQINTDGLTIKCPNSAIIYVDALKSWWMNLTKLELEEARYTRFFVRDVNNYIAEKPDGTLKRKGAYEYKLAWYQNHSALVIQKAAEATLIKGIDPKEFIVNHPDIYDFMLRTKVPRTSKLMLGDRTVQNVTRYFISVVGGPLVKIMPPLEGETRVRRIGINVGYNVTECNVMRKIDRSEINFDFYLHEAKKLIDILTQRV